MNNKTNKKLLVLSVIFLLFGVAMAVATSVPSTNYLKVKPVLNRAIQTIQRIAFNEDAIRHTDKPDREIIMESNHGTVMIRGRVFASTTGITNELTPNSTGSSLFYGRDNYLAGTDSYIIAGVNDTITSDVSNSTIVGGTNNILTRGDNIYIIGGSGNEIVTGKNSFIIGGHDNILSGNDSYIIGGSNTIVDANHSFAAGSDININKDYVFAWKDRSDDVILSPKKENTFTWFAQNGISIGYSRTNDTDPGTVDINGGFQVADEKKTCALNIAGAIQYIGGLYGCFCLCNGSTWESLTHSKNCRVSCSHLTGDVNDAGVYVGECRYKTEGGRTPKIWDIEPSQGCDNGMAINFTGHTNADGSLKGWTWQCVGNKGNPDDCAADATVQEGICSTTDNAGIADYYTKCASGYPTNIDTRADSQGIIKWTCMGVNSTVKHDCRGCENNYVYRNGVCKDETGKCNSTYNGKNLSSLMQSVDICYRGSIANFKTGYTEDKRVAGWNWDCVGTGANGPSVAKCKATYRSEPGRCDKSLVWGRQKYGDYVGVANAGKCNKGDLTGVVFYTGAHEMTWICSGVNFDRNAYCWGCDSQSQYNRHTGKCEAKTCDYETGSTTPEHITIDGIGAYVVTTCNRKITLMDKNLGADVAGINPNSYGYYYQWGNNHGFTPEEAKEKATQTRIPWSGDYNRKGYSGDSFVVQEMNENADVCTFYNYWTKGGSCTVHEDIWGGAKDGFVNWFYNNQRGIDTLYRVHTNDIDDYIQNWEELRAWNNRMYDMRDYMLNTGAVSRRGPCPEGWHVPSLGEWGALVNDWCLLNPDECKPDKGKSKINVGNGKSIGSITTSKDIDDRFMKAFKLPKAGRLIPDPEHQKMLVSDGSEGFYWSSSTYDAQHIGYSWFYSSSLYAMKANGEMRRGVPIRCFKNPEIIDDTAHNLANQ